MLEECISPASWSDAIRHMLKSRYQLFKSYPCLYYLARRTQQHEIGPNFDRSLIRCQMSMNLDLRLGSRKTGLSPFPPPPPYFNTDCSKSVLLFWFLTALLVVLAVCILGKSCSFGLSRVSFVNCCKFMYLVISFLVFRAGCGVWLYQFLIIVYLFTLLFWNIYE